VKWHYQQIEFVPLSETSLPELCTAIDEPVIARCLNYYSQPTVLAHLQVQAQRTSDIVFAICQNEQYLGMAGLLPYHDGWESITYLAARARRKGINSACKHMQWNIAQITGKPLYLGVKLWNTASIAAMRAHYPHVLPIQTESVSANGQAYRSWCWKADGPPALGTALTEPECLHLQEVVEKSFPLALNLR
jgi:hypothetical protein